MRACSDLLLNLLQPIPASFGGRRRLATHRSDPLLFEARLVRVRPPETAGSQVQCVLAPMARGGVHCSLASGKQPNCQLKWHTL
jgi:hypothetical protein